MYDSGTGLNNFQSKQGVQAANAKIIAKRNEYPQVKIKEFYWTKLCKVNGDFKIQIFLEVFRMIFNWIIFKILLKFVLKP